MRKRTFLAGLGVIAATALPMGLHAQEVTLRLHQFLPPQAPVPQEILKPWGERVSEATDGRIAIQHFDAMALGGRPSDLMDQARDGVVDLAMTLVGYTPNRFPRTEVFELPFMMTEPRATALAFWDMVETDWQDNEYGDLKVLGAWVHGPGVIHTADPVETLDDMQGKAMRGPTRVINDMLQELGATPVGMPLPAIPEALSKGVVSGTVIPWEVTSSIRLTELVDNHTEFGGDEALYTATIVLVMNRDSWNALDPDLQEALMAESGAKLSGEAAQIMYDFDAPAREIAVEAGNNIITLGPEEVAPWKEAAQPVIDRWVGEMDGRGIDGRALIEQARGLIEQHSQ
ncbi:TRAP transporter substrate-binding protein [Palleronia sp. LCG004]|uniref:TRAP transporter substrate-binding protein n=1 Tax=Palleronia sp. LCG004 TaxID=3079304 RepID=UPI002941E495|nr:TRAP transporter substrate-binding protein [Palleronia sp. LCG004]WOI55259.1 TRAP transporter substrate-binding protein [Palleronia sp. LCG004]